MHSIIELYISIIKLYYDSNMKLYNDNSRAGDTREGAGEHAPPHLTTLFCVAKGKTKKEKERLSKQKLLKAVTKVKMLLF